MQKKINHKEAIPMNPWLIAVIVVSFVALMLRLTFSLTNMARKEAKEEEQEAQELFGKQPPQALS